MTRYGGWKRPGRLWPVALAVAILAGLTGASVVAAAGGLPAECSSSAATLGDARAAYSNSCELPRIDCDEIDDLWYCSSRVIGNAAPGGASADDVGESSIGKDTVVVTLPPTIRPPTTEPPITVAPTTAPPGTVAPPAPSTTAPPTTEPAPTEPPTTEAPTTDPTPAPTTAPPVAPPAPTVAPTTAPAPVPTTNPGASDGLTRRTYPKTDGPDRNPLKGWNSGWSDDRPESTVGFQYIPWKEFEPQNGVFDFDAVEDIIDRSGSRNRHLILRLYCDWHGDNQESRGCPSWIYSDVGVDRIRDNGRYITDYNDPRYLDEAEQAIDALAGRYDDDPRLYAFQLGLIGYWGEWHTYGSSYEISRSTEQRILDAYESAFDRTHLMARYPYRSIMVDAPTMGFHNDYFRPSNGHSAEFDDAVSAGSRWVGGPIGGEVPPGLSSNDYREMYATSQGRDMIETGHYSTMKPGSVSGQYLGEHLALHKRFGYNFQIDEARFAASHSGAGQLRAELSVENTGIAPFYYDWQVQFALLDGNGNPVATTEAESYDLRRHQPGDTFSLTANLPMSGVGSGEYDLAVRILQPGADTAKSSAWKLDARNTYVLFANDLSTTDGSWNSRNQLVGGWSILGEVRAN